MLKGFQYFCTETTSKRFPHEKSFLTEFRKNRYKWIPYKMIFVEIQWIWSALGEWFWIGSNRVSDYKVHKTYKRSCRKNNERQTKQSNGLHRCRSREVSLYLFNCTLIFMQKFTGFFTNQTQYYLLHRFNETLKHLRFIYLHKVCYERWYIVWRIPTLMKEE